MNGRYVAWCPLPDIPEELYVEALYDDVEGFRILLRAEDPTSPTLRVLFESMVAYRNMNEIYRNRTWQIWRKAGVKRLPALMMVEDSRWVQWLVEESGSILEAENVLHYAIYTPEDCIDVASQFPPIVNWLNAIDL